MQLPRSGRGKGAERPILAWSFCLLMLLAVLVAGPLTASSGCFWLHPSMGGGQTRLVVERDPRADDVAVPEGYGIELVATGLTFPTGVTFDEEGIPYVVESGYSYGEVFETSRLLRIAPEGIEEIASAAGAGWMGVAYAEGAFFIAEAGVLQPGRVIRVERDGSIEALVEGLPSLGDHHVNGPVVAEGWVYFGVGVATNSGVVGEDNAEFGWLKRFPDFHDVPCRDVTLAGVNMKSRNPLTDNPDATLETGPFLPFGHRARAGQVVAGRIPCTGSILRVPTSGGGPELVAWGFRNPFGLALAPDGRLFTTDNGYDERGSRPIYGAPDLLWHVQPGHWYGWPDFVGGIPTSDQRFGRLGGKAQPPVLAEAPMEPPQPVARLGVHSSSNGFDISRSERFGHIGDAFIAQFGDQAPVVGKVWAPVGFQVVRVELDTGVVHSFARNKAKASGPASYRRTQGLERPIAARFDPSGAALYVVDFGILRMTAKKSHPERATGALWRIARGEPVVARAAGRKSRGP
jgi:hypothetical protein